MRHISVLPKEVIEGLDLKKGEIFVDATLGSAGHSLQIAQSLKNKIKIIGIDQDPKRIEEVKKLCEVEPCGEIEIVNGNFRNIDKILNKLGIEKVDKILFDLGLNSEQLENSGRGFSFQKNEPLMMNFSPKPEFTAAEIVNSWEEGHLADIFYAYGEERFSRQIAKKIVELRKEKRIETTQDLVAVIEKAVPNWYKHKRIHFATKTFQALRITVNDELGALKEGLAKAFSKLRGGGRIAVISFHGLEDSVTKNYFKDLQKQDLAMTISKKAIRPQIKEVLANPRARSAKLRIIEKI